jgi:hypothetical protein
LWPCASLFILDKSVHPIFINGREKEACALVYVGPATGRSSQERGPARLLAFSFQGFALKKRKILRGKERRKEVCVVLFISVNLRAHKSKRENILVLLLLLLLLVAFFRFLCFFRAGQKQH